MEERGFFCFMAPVYLLAPNMLLTFLIIFTPSISPSKTAMPVLKARIMALPLSAAGARGANSSLAVSVMISFCTCNFFRNSFFRSDTFQSHGRGVRHIVHDDIIFHYHSQRTVRQ